MAVPAPPAPPPPKHATPSPSKPTKIKTKTQGASLPIALRAGQVVDVARPENGWNAFIVSDLHLSPSESYFSEESRELVCLSFIHVF